MERLKIYPLSMSREEILQERNEAYNKLSSYEKMESLFQLIELSRMLNNGQLVKTPQGKGIILRKIAS